MVRDSRLGTSRLVRLSKAGAESPTRGSRGAPADLEDGRRRVGRAEGGFHFQIGTPEAFLEVEHLETR